MGIFWTIAIIWPIIGILTHWGHAHGGNNNDCNHNDYDRDDYDAGYQDG